jgi:hypothetical protein
MAFDGYFDATDEAIVVEKEIMFGEIGRLRATWDESLDLDRQCAKKSSDLHILKDLLSKSHIQILRTREEILRMELGNAV